MFIVFFTEKNCVCLYILDLFHILPSLWHTCRPIECMHVGTYICMTSTYNAFIDPPIHITALEGNSEMTILWNKHGMNLKVVEERQTEKKKWEWNYSISLSGCYLATQMLLLTAAAFCLYL